MAEILIQIENDGMFCRVPGGTTQCHCLTMSGSAPVCVAFHEPAVGSRKHKTRAARIVRSVTGSYVRRPECIEAENKAKHG